ncbi:MAG: outer membrane protein transport protein [Deltaproteobacteria bacterium]|nr:outer membrane protein transport protein [Deltaproteobacteria bacterium]MCL5276789.1 outer membrane protein transport protein [Deltaproteobacteria bacterium]
MKKRLLFLTIGTILVLNGHARASVFDTFGVDSKGIAMGDARTASADDWTATYYNPAGITQRKSSVGASFIFVWNHLDVKPFPGSAGLENRDNMNTQGMSLGLTYSFGLDFFRLGVGLYLPLDDVQKQITHFPDATEYYFTDKLYFELDENMTERQIVLPTIALKLFPFLSIGAGVSLFIHSSTYSNVYVPNVIDLSDVFINVNDVQTYTYVPNLGVLFHPSKDFKIGVSYMGRDSFPLEGAAFVYAPSSPIGQHFTQPIEQIIFFTPAHISAGVMYRPNDEIELDGDVTWVEWSQYRDNHNVAPQTQWIDPNTNTLQPGQAWNDVYVPRIGVEYKPSPSWSVMAGYFYEPTPIPPQTQRTNFVDNVKNIVSAGGGYKVPYKDGNLSFLMHFQAQILGDRKTYKEIAVDADPNTPGVQNPGYPGYESRGYILDTGFEVNYAF